MPHLREPHPRQWAQAQQTIELTAAALSRKPSRHTAALQAAQPSRVLAATASSAPTVQCTPNLCTRCAGNVHSPSEPPHKTTQGATPTPCDTSAGNFPNPVDEPVKTDSALQQTADEQQQDVVMNMVEKRSERRKSPRTSNWIKRKMTWPVRPLRHFERPAGRAAQSSPLHRLSMVLCPTSARRCHHFGKIVVQCSPPSKTGS